MSTEELINELAVKVDGKKDSKDVLIFTLSTCMWCKKCKRWLNDRDVKYQYVDVDKIQYSQKAKILEYLKENYQSRISYPFMVCDGETVVGYDPNKYEELLNKEGGTD
ncbi:MAG: glutaredoxin family protein [Candidatus Lokiarchaeota archaeon]|nr:glutaredoxin family protein [Candidatus Lokiarchaeota archaeon]MBD3338514.1 glutaredoxin family protein [Candidatus Lokiarchaeota archaeon]